MKAQNQTEEEEYEEYEEDTAKESENVSDWKEEIEAILNLDFERALAVSKKNMQIQKSKEYAKLSNEEAYYKQQSQILTQQVFDDYKSELSGIRQQYLNDAEYYKNIWQSYCKNLVNKQRDEAYLLEQKWRDARKIEIERAQETAKTKLATAKLLAMCKLYKNAIDVRDKAQNITDPSKTPGVKKIDKEFAKQYIKMTKRHYTEFQCLYNHLRSLMQNLRSNADSLREKAEANLEVEKARNNTLIIRTVASNAVSKEVKEKIFQNFSPRNKGKSGARPFSPRNEKVPSPKAPVSPSAKKC